jgi:cation transport regulator ChaC
MYYFAYGSNMSAAQMRRRLGEVRRLGGARLRDYTLVFDGVSRVNWPGSAVANIVPMPGGQVWGVLYQVEDLAALDRLEGAPKDYERRVVPVEYRGETLEAAIYVRAPRDVGAPTRAYLLTMLRGAAHNRLPVGYVWRVLKSARP